MAITIVTDIFTQVDTVLNTTLGGKTASVINIISPVIMAGFILYVLLVTMSYMKNGTDITEIGGDLIQRFIGWSVVIGLSMNIGNFNDIVMPMVNGIPNEISQAISNNTATTVTQNLDNLATLYATTISNMMNAVELTDIGGMIISALIALVIMLGGCVFLVIAGGTILLVKVMTAILLVLAPIFIALALFPATRQYVGLWVSQVVSYGLILILVSIITTIEIGILNNTINVNTELDITQAITLCIANGIFIVILLLVPAVASALSGGMALNGYLQAGRTVGSFIPKPSKNGTGGAGKSSNRNKSGSSNAIKPEGAGK